MNSINFICLLSILLTAQRECNNVSPEVRKQTPPAAVNNIQQQSIVITNDSTVPMPNPSMIKIDNSIYSRQIDSISRLIELNPEDAILYARRAELKGSMGDQPGACEDYRQAKKLGGEVFNISIEKYCQ